MWNTILIIFGLFWLFAALVSMTKTGDFEAADIVLLIILGLLPLSYGIWKKYLKKKQQWETQEQILEKHVLRLAKSMQGRVTVVDVAQKTPLSLEKAQKQLDEFVTRGYADYEVGDKGAIIYRFFMLENPRPENQK